jgi:hypothetical protein
VPVSDSGSFEFRNIAPGSYELVATLNAAAPAMILSAAPMGNVAGFTAATPGVARGARGGGGPVMAARTQVDVVNADIEGVSLLLDNGFNISGKFTIDGRAAGDPATSGLRVLLQSDPVMPPFAIPPATSEADGAFSVNGVTPGNYRLSIAGLPRNTYVRSASLAGVEVLNSGGLHLDGEPRGTLDIVLGNSPGSLDATIVDNRKLPVSAVTVVLVPEFAKRKRFDLFRQATSDASGRIHLDGIVPGEYKVFAWEVVETNSWTDPDFLRNYENNGAPVSISEGGRAAADVHVIPFRAN